MSIKIALYIITVIDTKNAENLDIKMMEMFSILTVQTPSYVMSIFCCFRSTKPLNIFILFLKVNIALQGVGWFFTSHKCNESLSHAFVLFLIGMFAYICYLKQLS